MLSKGTRGLSGLSHCYHVDIVSTDTVVVNVISYEFAFIVISDAWVVIVISNTFVIIVICDTFVLIVITDALFSLFSLTRSS